MTPPSLTRLAVPRTAEDVLPGHPDRVCDAIAEALVRHACRIDPEALVGVEVALHRRFVAVTGRIAAGDGRDAAVDDATVDRLATEAFVAAGYTEGWRHDVEVVSDLDVGPLADDERSIRRFSDDQGIAVGHADPDTPDHRPIEAGLARAVRRALGEVRSAHADVLGPDGKVLVTVGPGTRPRISHLNVAIQHVPGIGFDDLHRIVVPALAGVIDTWAAWVEPPAVLDGDTVRINGIGDFTCGGPAGDNGLSGKKLVVDHYGPQVPIGGGAICGKDVHKPDRVGAIRARQVACRLAAATGTAITVHTGWLPGLEEPDRLWAVGADGTVFDADTIAATISVPDLSLAGAARDLELAAVDWPSVMREGYFGSDRPWDR